MEENISGGGGEERLVVEVGESKKTNGKRLEQDIEAC